MPLTRKLSNKITASRLRIQFSAALGLIIVGCALLIAGFIVPPLGQIHPSLLIAFGEILTFVGALFGIDYHYKNLYSHHANH